ncbi:nucleoside/nucleotide kinase family protein [Aureimonas leprariae]|uniref:Nucleoside/nucleotide kinase family protein n=1 Tax=Plantimonas leprariae TaxID=2615207 RepID=A0A7V7TX88_9HYPH|nr:nucleoside/nucleotide kinase family protein [Aureimonas leprariae]KAB0681249.1 nucleoside/nucleotide kinase family protein [Aureimonas leprariae]
MAETVTLPELAERLLAEAGDARRLVALAGPPGAGKTTAADRLKELLNERRPGVADILPMDGYHFDDLVLNARGHRPRKGAPHTFDLLGFRAMVERLRADDGTDIAVPVFDRDLEIARAGARIVAAGTRIVVVEGNYLLLDEPGWRDLKPLFHRTAKLVASEAVLEARLTRRWEGYGYQGARMVEKMEGNDLPNMRLVLARSLDADYDIRSDGE